ncbi:CBS domain-containing protein, partial [Candidatus Woesearchaeota archaeon]|nr:CBS domain-containing protein [Candidatus Woesearchaeota archaeon]
MGFFTKRKHYVNAYYELNAIKVRDIMIKDVMCIHKGDKLIDAAHTMIGAHISCLVVLENYKPIGILTERDFIKKLDMTTEHSEELLVNDVMTKKLFTVDTHLDLFKAQGIMREHNFRKLIIVEDEDLKGIITQTDLCRAVAELKSPHPRAPLVKQVMTKGVLMVEEDDKFLKAKKLMASNDIGSVIVADNKQIKG